LGACNPGPLTGVVAVGTPEPLRATRSAVPLSEICRKFSPAHPGSRWGTRVLRVQTARNPARIGTCQTGRRAAPRRAFAGGWPHGDDFRNLTAGGKESATQIGVLGRTDVHVELCQYRAAVRSRGPDGGRGQSENFGDLGLFCGLFRAHASGNSVRSTRPPALPFLPARRFTARPDAAIGERVPLPSTNEARAWPARQDPLELTC
jgi:hypothetical protein